MERIRVDVCNLFMNCEAETAGGGSVGGALALNGTEAGTGGANEGVASWLRLPLLACALLCSLHVSRLCECLAPLSVAL